MTWQELLTYCLAKPGAWQDEPWDGDVVVKVGQQDLRVPGVAAGLRGGAEMRPGP